MSVFGNRLKTLRKSRNLSQEEFAAEFNKKFNLKIDRTMISKWETGFQTPVMNTVAMLAKFFNVSIDYLNGDEESENINYQYDTENNTPAQFDISPNTFILSEPEKKLITAYRNKPEMQPAINKILGIETETKECKHKSTTEKTHIIKIAARNGSYKELALNDEELEELQRKINSLPEATDL